MRTLLCLLVVMGGIGLAGSDSLTITLNRIQLKITECKQVTHSINNNLRRAIKSIKALNDSLVNENNKLRNK